MDLFGRERARLRQELEQLAHQRDEAVARADAQTQRAQKASKRARERQDRLMELENVIEDLRGEVAIRGSRGAGTAELQEAERALRDAQAIHSAATR